MTLTFERNEKEEDEWDDKGINEASNSSNNRSLIEHPVHTVHHSSFCDCSYFASFSGGMEEGRSFNLKHFQSINQCLLHILYNMGSENLLFVVAR